MSGNKTMRGILGVSLAAGCILWLIDGILDYSLFYAGKGTLSDFILFRVPPEKLFLRIVFLLVLLGIGFAISKILSRHHEDETNLLRSESYYRSLLHYMHEGILVIAPDYVITDVNKKFLEETGYDRAEVVGKKCYHISHGYDGPCREFGEVCQLETVILTSEPRQCRHEHLRADGSKEWVDILISPLKDEKGNVTHVIQSIRDVSDQIAVEKALLESEFRYLSLFQSSQEAIFLINGEDITDCNPATERLFECELNELIGNSIFHFCPESQPDGTNTRWKGTQYVSLTVNGAPQRFEWVFTTKAGKLLEVEISLSRIHIGGQSHLLTMVWDIGDLKKAQEILRQERRRLADILDGSPVPTFVINRKHRVVHWNRSCEYITGLTRESVLDQPLNLKTLHDGKQPLVVAELILEMSDSEILDRYRQIRKNDTYADAFEFTGHITVKGEKRIVSILASRLRDSRGDLIGAIQCAQDITEKEQLQKQLLQSQKMEAIGTLAGGIAHDFNNMLFPIIGYTEMAITKIPEDNPARRYLGQVYQAANRARDLVQQILTFSRKSEQERRPLRIHPVVKEALKLLRASLPASIEMSQNIDGNCSPILADPVQIHQLIMNLCTNAYHAIGSKGGKLEVTMTEEMVDSSDLPGIVNFKTGEYIRLSVRDTGKGIPQDVLKRIFEPFFTTKAPGEGTGMGLAVVHGIVNNHGGHIQVESEPGQGSVFTVYFPKYENETAPPEPPSIVNVPGGDERVLLVDDEEQIILLIEDILTSIGYSVTVCRKSQDALDVFMERPDDFDLVITDQTMPNIQGTELAEAMLKIRPDIPIILGTGYKETGTWERAKKLGIREVFTKPVSGSDLAGIVRTVLDTGCGTPKTI